MFGIVVVVIGMVELGVGVAEDKDNTDVLEEESMPFLGAAMPRCGYRAASIAAGLYSSRESLASITGKA